MKFILQVALAMAVSLAGAWLADKLLRHDNREAQAAERIAGALERAYPARAALMRPSLLNENVVTFRRTSPTTWVERPQIKILVPEPDPCDSAQTQRCGL